MLNVDFSCLNRDPLDSRRPAQADVKDGYPLKSGYHRLNGSSSPVLTATSLSYGKSKNSTPHRIKTPDPIKIKFGTVDYVGEGTRHAKFYANPSKGGFPANG